jgi:primosomal protein N'
LRFASSQPAPSARDLDVPLDRAFDYRTDKPNTQIGQYVVVPFGARKMIGVVVGISDTTAIESKKLKSIIRLDPEVIFDEQSFKLFQFCSQYYHYPLGQTILSAVPSRLKKINTKAMAKKYLYRLTPKAIELGVDQLPPRQTTLKRIVMALIDATLLDEASLRSMSSAWKKSIETLDEMGWIENRETTKLIYLSVLDVIGHLEKMATNGQKSLLGQSPTSEHGEYRLYLNDIVSGDNTLLVELGESKITYLNHSVLYFVGSKDPEFNEVVFRNMENTINKSSLMSGSGEKERTQVFNSLRKKVYLKLEAMDLRPKNGGFG